MTFPVIFHPFGLSLHAHVLFEVLAYTIGFQTYLWLRRREKRRGLATETQLWVLVGCVFGAFVGSKMLAWAEIWPTLWAHRADPAAWAGGKTIVGGLIGGWAGVEIAKKALGVCQRTGDTYVIPLCLGIAIGRIGCFLTGLDDQTHGIGTSLPWGIDFGDGIRRHPTQLYEIAWLLTMSATFVIFSQREAAGGGGGRIFRLFMVGYLLFRFLVEFIKPSWKPYAGLSAIQVASLLTAGVAAWQMWNTTNRDDTPNPSPTAPAAADG